MGGCLFALEGYILETIKKRRMKNEDTKRMKRKETRERLHRELTDCNIRIQTILKKTKMKSIDPYNVIKQYKEGYYVWDSDNMNWKVNNSVLKKISKLEKIEKELGVFPCFG